MACRVSHARGERFAKFAASFRHTVVVPFDGASGAASATTGVRLCLRFATRPEDNAEISQSRPRRPPTHNVENVLWSMTSSADAASCSRSSITSWPALSAAGPSDGGCNDRSLDVASSGINARNVHKHNSLASFVVDASFENLHDVSNDGAPSHAFILHPTRERQRQFRQRFACRPRSPRTIASQFGGVSPRARTSTNRS